MKTIFSLLALLLTTSAIAGSGSGNVSNVVNYGGGALTSNIANGVPPYITLPPSLLSNVVVLMGGNASITNDNYYAFYSSSAPSSTTQYQVPSGKTFYILGMYWAAGTTNDRLQLGYGTAAATENSSSAPTGAVYYSASSTVTTTPYIATVAIPAYTWFPVGGSFPANDYPFWRPDGVSGDGYRVILIGYVQ